jgi:taurine dioxygenase
MTYQKIEVERCSPYLGAFIEAVDLSSPLDVATVREIRAALLEFGVIFFRNQPISGERHLEIAACFGEIDEPHPICLSF